MSMLPENKRCREKYKSCPCCGSTASLQMDKTIFIGQNYSDRYKKPVASQSWGYQIRCDKCGLQTCWWHYPHEAATHWNKRKKNKELKK